MPAIDLKKQQFFDYDGMRHILMPGIRVLQVFGEVDTDVAAPLIACLHYINATAGSDRTPIKVFVNSDGGSFEDGFAIADVIRTSEIPVETYCAGRAYSVALPIFMAGSTRYAYKNSAVMFHGVSLETGGTAKSLRSTVDGADKSNQIMMEFIASRSKIPPSMLKGAIEKNKDLYLYPEDLLRYKMVHKIL